MPLNFAYGSNLSNKQMEERCPSAKFISVGWLPGYRLDFTRYSKNWKGGVADVVSSPDDDVWGVVYSLNEADFEVLDDYEGFPGCYDRFQADIFTLEGKLGSIWVYTVTKKADFIPPTEEYLAIIRKAAEDYNFSPLYREALRLIRTAQEIQ